MRPERPNRLLAVLSSLDLTIACLLLLFVLVFVCTLAQVSLGIHEAVSRTIRSFFIWWTPGEGSWRLPIFPGGASVGLVLLANLAVAQLGRLERSWRKAGLWIIHLGLVFLFVGEFVSGALQVDSSMAIEEGQTKSYSEDYRRMELAVVDASDPAYDEARLFPGSLLEPGRELTHRSLPFRLVVHAWHDNALLKMREPSDPPSRATAGIGMSLTLHPQPPVTADDEQNTAAALVEPIAGDKSYGVFLLSDALGAPQSFLHAGRRWVLSVRRRRYYLPFSLTLKDFRHDRYPGTDIPKNFSSLVRLKDPAAGDDRDALIWMNNPLRHAGLTFYQSSFGKNDTLSVLQVVKNPGWRIPYLASALVALGLCWHFFLSLRRALKPALP